MSTIKWHDVTLGNMQPAMTLQKQIKAITAYGGIHDWSFVAELEDLCAGTISEVWNTAGASGTWSYSGGELQGIGGGSSEWHGLVSNDDMPQVGAITFTKKNNRGAALIRATDEDTGYLVYWDSNSIGVSYLDSGSEEALIDLPKTYTGEAEVEIAWREVQYTQNDPHRWLFITVWFDGELGLTYGDNMNDRTLGNKVGFAVYDSDTITFDDIEVPELSYIGDWASIDENDAPMGGLNRLLNGRHVRMFARYDGTLRVWKPAAVSSSATVLEKNIIDYQRTLDRRGLISHTRVWGAFVSADAIDTTIAKLIGHRYMRIDNPNLMTEQECVDEAEYVIDRSQEQSDTAKMRIPALVLIEPEDRLTIPDGDYLIEAIEMSGSQSTLVAIYQLRSYVS